MSPQLTTQQIGKCGELLVQYRLLENGIESAPMTTDSGIDLVAYSLKRKKAITIQVKTVLMPKKGGGRGRQSLDWWVPETSDAELYAFVDMSNEQIWLVKNQEMAGLAQQNPPGRFHFFMILDPEAKPRKDGKMNRLADFDRYRLESRIGRIFGANA